MRRAFQRQIKKNLSGFCAHRRNRTAVSSKDVFLLLTSPALNTDIKIHHIQRAMLPSSQLVGRMVWQCVCEMEQRERDREALSGWERRNSDYSRLNTLQCLFRTIHLCVFCIKEPQMQVFEKPWNPSFSRDRFCFIRAHRSLCCT